MIALLTYPAAKPALSASSLGVRKKTRAADHTMKRVTIDLAGPFEEILANLCSVPWTDDLDGNKNTVGSELSPEVQEVTRSIYEAARGRQFATLIGLVQAGPLPTAPFLQHEPFQVESQADFLLRVLARLYGGACSKAKSPSRETQGNQNPRAGFSYKRILPPPAEEPCSCN